MRTHAHARTCSLNIEFLDVHSMSASSQLPRLYATHARLGSRFSAYLRRVAPRARVGVCACGCG